MRLHRSDSRVERFRAYGFVGAQFVLLSALGLWDPPPDLAVPSWLDAGARLVRVFGLLWVAVGLVGLGRSLTALPLPVIHGRLRTDGPYRLSRHPIYTGVLALGWSWGVRASAVGPLVLAGLLHIVLYRKARFEEDILERFYPAYADYAKRVPRFLPIGVRLRKADR